MMRRVEESGADGGRGERVAPAVRAGFDRAEFRRVMGHYPTGVTVVTAACGDGPAGLVIGSFTSVSLDPPLVSFCLDRGSASGARMRSADNFCVNVLAEDQVGLCAVFSGRSGDRFSGLPTRAESTGAPVIEGCLAWIDCRLRAIHPAGDHYIMIGEVAALSAADAGGPDAGGPADRSPLVFLRGAYGRFEGL